MREIKFRAWDKKNKKMLQPRAWRFKGWLGVIKTIHMTNTDILGTKTPPDVSPTENLKPSRSLKEFTLMQYTGLRDKNGKEIYEGDLVNFPTGSSINYKVMFKNAGWYWGMKTPIGSMHKAHAELEVIGNIYESPELINKEYD